VYVNHKNISDELVELNTRENISRINELLHPIYSGVDYVRNLCEQKCL